VSIDRKNSIMRDLNRGTVQGSILCPILYAIYVTPLFNLLHLTNFADDNFIISWNSSIPGLVIDLQADLQLSLNGSGVLARQSMNPRQSYFCSIDLINPE
jgi:hypothetical protein